MMRGPDWRWGVTALVWFSRLLAESAPLTIPAAEFSDIGGGRIEDDALVLPERAVARAGVRVPMTGRHILVLAARVSPDASDSPAQVHTRIDGIPEGRFFIQPSEVWNTYSVPLRLERGARIVTLEHAGEIGQNTPEEVRIHSLVLVQDDRRPGLESMKSDGIRDLDAERRVNILENAQRNIVSERQGPMVVQILDAEGMPAAGATVDLFTLQPRFGFGVNLCPEAFHPNRPTDGHAAYATRVLELFNTVASGTAANWIETQPAPSVIQPDLLLSMKHFAQTHEVPLFAAGLFANTAQRAPPWALDLNSVEFSGAVDDRITRLMQDTLSDVENVEVLSEFTDGMLLSAHGGSGLAVELFKQAKEVAPEVRPYIGRTWPPRFSRQIRFYEEIEDLMARGAPIQGISLDCRFALPVDLPAFQQELDELSLLKLPIRISRLEVSGGDPEQRQDHLIDLLTLLYGQSRVKAVYLDGVWSECGVGEEMALYRQDLSPTAFGLRMERLLRQTWRTSFRAQTGAEGLVDEYVVYGTTRIQVTYPNGEQEVVDVEHDSGDPTRVTVRMEP